MNPYTDDDLGAGPDPETCATCTSTDVIVRIVGDDVTDPNILYIEIDCNECGSVAEERIRA